MGLVEIKYRFPYVMTGNQYRYLGKRSFPAQSVPAEHYLQCQFQMLVTDKQLCYLVSYSCKGGTLVYKLHRSDLLCRMMLQLIQHTQQVHIVHGVLPSDGQRGALTHELHPKFLEVLANEINAVSECKKEVDSEFNQSTGQPFFLDEAEPSIRRQHILANFLGEHSPPLNIACTNL